MSDSKSDTCLADEPFAHPHLTHSELLDALRARVPSARYACRAA